MLFILTWFKLCRENTANWKVKEIDSKEPTSNGYCSLNPKEVGIFLTALGYPSSTPIYIAAGEIDGGDARMADLQTRYPIMMSKVLLVSDVVCDSCLKSKFWRLILVKS